MAENKSAKIATEVGVTKWAELPFVSKASRLEVLIIRPIWTILFTIVLYVYMLVFSIILAVFGIVWYILVGIQWLIILFAGKRWEAAFNWSAKFQYQKFVPYFVRLSNYSVRFTPYLMWLTDARPPLGFNASNDEYFKPIVKSARSPSKAKRSRKKPPAEGEV